MSSKKGTTSGSSLDDYGFLELPIFSLENTNPDVEDIDTQEKRRFKQDTLHRKILMYWVISVVSCWLIVVLVLLFLSGFGIVQFQPTVLVTLLATTTINVLGLAFIVLRGIFFIPTKRAFYNKNKPTNWHQ